MIYFNGHKITGVHINNKVITKIYKGTRLVWQLIMSCFGAGHWIRNYPWRGADGWRYNNN